MLLIKVLLKLWELVQVPLFLPQPISGIAELAATSAAATVSTKARTAAVAANKAVVFKVGFNPERPFPRRQEQFGTNKDISTASRWKVVAAVYFPASRGTMENSRHFVSAFTPPHGDTPTSQLC